jgi:hypothetical protein
MPENNRRREGTHTAEARILLFMDISSLEMGAGSQKIHQTPHGHSNRHAHTRSLWDSME